MHTLALVGGGHIHTPNFIKRLNAREGIAVKSVWDHDAQRAEARAADLSATVTADLAAIWSDDEIGAVIICAETNRHEDLVLAAAEAGKHMFVEKPLGIGVADSAGMARAIEAAGVLFQTGYFMRSAPINRFLKAQIEAGSFGRITRLRHSNCHAGSLGGWFDTEWRWMADLSQAGVGGFGDLGTHSLDIMMWLLGDVERVTADIRIITGRYGETDETGEALLAFENGVIGTLAAGWVDVANPVSLEVAGTQGHAAVFNGDLYFKSERVEGADGKQPWTDLPEALPHAFDLFLDAVMGDQSAPLVSPREAAARSAVMAAMYRASAEQAWITPEKLA